MPCQRKLTPKGWRLAAAVVACAVSAAAAPAASALVVHARNGHFFGVELHRGTRASALRGSIAAQPQPAAHPPDSGTLDYHGGPVVHSSAPYLIFWIPSGESISARSQSLMKRYFTDVAADSNESDDVYGVTRQYTDAAGFAGERQTFDGNAQALIDAQPYPPTDKANCSGSTTCLTDAQLQTELKRLIGAKSLPTDGPAGTPDLLQDAPIYFIVLPGDVNLCAPGLGCASSSFCAYHSSASDGSNTVLYAAIPMLLADTNPKACQSDGNSAAQEPNGDPADVVIGDLSHEDNETISDPLGTSWYDNISGNEEGDGCATTGSFSPAAESNPDAFLPTLGGDPNAGTLYDQLINGDQYYTQSEWSNGDPGCEMQPSAGTIDASFSAPSGPNPAGSSLTFDPTASTSTHPISSETWDFGDGSPTAFHVGSLTSVSHSYATGGTYTVTLTLVDNRGDLRIASTQVAVEAEPSTAALTVSPGPLPPPTARFVVTTPHPAAGVPVHFNASSSTESGGSITSYLWSFGDGSTAHGVAAAHTYARAGTYRVSLTVLSSSGSPATVHETIVVVRGSRIKKISILRERGSALLTIALTGPGRLSVGSRRFAIARAKTIMVRVTPTAAQRLRLQSVSHLTLLVPVAFTPKVGRPTKRHVSITLSG